MNKISKIQIGMALSLLMCSFYLGISDIILASKSNNSIIPSIIFGLVIGFIPVLMYLKINSFMPNKNIYEKNTYLFGKVFGNLINILIILMYVFMLTVVIRAISIFVISKYLGNTPFLLFGSLVVLVLLIISFKGIETVFRVSQVSFLFAFILAFIIEALLINYVDLNNLFPIISKNFITDTLNGGIYFASSSSLLVFLLLVVKKDDIENVKHYNLTIILFYLLGVIALLLVAFFVISCFGYDMASIFRYPEYIILKKIGLSNSDLHLENLLAFRWIFYMLTLGLISSLGIISGTKNFIKNVKIKNIVVIIISVISLILSKYLFGSVTHSIIIIKDYYTKFIALPVFIIFFIIFIFCFIRKEE